MVKWCSIQEKLIAFFVVILRHFLVFSKRYQAKQDSAVTRFPLGIGFIICQVGSHLVRFYINIPHGNVKLFTNFNHQRW